MNKLLVIAVLLLSVMLWAQTVGPFTFGAEVGPLANCKPISQITLCAATDSAGNQGLYISTKASATFVKLDTVGSPSTPQPIVPSFKCDSFTATNTGGVTSGATLSGCR